MPRAPTLNHDTAMQLLRTITPNGTRYFIEGRRTTRERYEQAKFWRTLECFQTTIKRGVIRHYAIAR